MRFLAAIPFACLILLACTPARAYSPDCINVMTVSGLQCVDRSVKSRVAAKRTKAVPMPVARASAPARKANLFNAYAGHCRRTSTDVYALAPALQAEIAKIERTYGPVEIVSGCRPGSRVSGTGRLSLHHDGRAVDIKLRNGRTYLLDAFYGSRQWKGGYGRYSGGMSHRHISIGGIEDGARWHTFVPFRKRYARRNGHRA